MLQSEKQAEAAEMFPPFPLSLGVTYKKLWYLFRHLFSVKLDRVKPGPDAWKLIIESNFNDLSHWLLHYTTSKSSSIFLINFLKILASWRDCPTVSQMSWNHFSSLLLPAVTPGPNVFMDWYSIF